MDIQQDLFEAMYSIAKGVIEQQEFDVTKECRIIEVILDNQGMPTGEYKVKSQDAVYTAYAQNSNEVYKMNEVVYVQIPNGDYNNDKFIIGRKIDKDSLDSMYNLKMPFDDFLGFYDLTQNDKMNQKGYKANYPNHGVNGFLAPQTGLTNNVNHMWHWENVGHEPIYATKLGISIDVTSLLHNFKLISGSYGFRVVLHGLSQTTQLESTAEHTRDFYFTDKNMYGNPYAYTTPTTQQMVVDITDFLRLDSIDIWFWQDHNFINELGEKIPYTQIDSNELIAEMEIKIKEIQNSNLSDAEKNLQIQQLMNEFSEQGSKSAGVENIYFENLQLLLGMSVDEIDDEKLMVFTYDQIIYGDHPDSELVRKPDRTLQLVWAHVMDDAMKLVDTYGELKEAEAELFWYKYDPDWNTESDGFDVNQISHRLGGTYWRPIKDTATHNDNDKINITVTPDREKSSQKYKAIVWFNNTYSISNIIVFSNYYDVEAENADSARNDKVIFRVGVLNEAQDNLTAEDAFSNFFVYNENNTVLANDDNIRFSDIRYYIEPWVKIGSGENAYYQRLSEYRDADNNYYDINVEWEWPENYSMIKVTGEIGNQEESIPFWNARWNHGDVLLKDRDIMTTRYFQISEYLDYRYINNTIAATVTIDHKVFNIKLDMLFGRAMDFGCEYVPVLKINTPAGNAYTVSGQTWEIECLVYDRQGRPVNTKARQYIWKRYSGGKYSEGVDIGRSNNICTGTINSAGDPFVIECTVRGLAEYDIVVRRGIMTVSNGNWVKTHEILCPDRVEFRSDGQAPIFYTSPLEVQEYTNGTNKILDAVWTTSNRAVCVIKTEDRTTFNTIYYDNGQTEQIAAGTFKQYYMRMASTLVNSGAADEKAYAPQWSEKYLKDEYFTYLQCVVSGVTIKQAIAFAINTYPSSLVNEWNGTSLSIDEANAAIIGQMFAAGTKNSKNEFTGIMMGDWSPKADESLDIPGIYGVQSGQQSFGFKTDGTGFIGLPGYGRIEFDGRNALISNAGRSCYINLNPRMVSAYSSGTRLNSDAWDIMRGEGYSQFFLYCQAPKRVKSAWENPSSSYDWASQLENTWGRTFMEDEEHEYFIVDPNNGVLTTGGIIASYGRIGKSSPWIIHDYGLTQKNIFGIIYLGNPAKNFLSSSAPTPTYTYNGREISNPKDYWDANRDNLGNFFAIAVANSAYTIQTGIRTDGYFYTKFASIGGWCINDSEMYFPASGNSSFRKTYSADGYLNDYININAITARMSFYKGSTYIDGMTGTISLANGNTTINGSTGTISLANGNTTIDGTTGTISLANGNTVISGLTGTADFANGVTVINGSTGDAYFAKGQVQIRGSSATIYCGISFENSSIFPGFSTVEQGNLYLANILLSGLTAKGSESINMGTMYNTITDTQYTYKKQKDIVEATGTNYSGTENIVSFDLGSTGNIDDDNSSGSSSWANIQQYSGTSAFKNYLNGSNQTTTTTANFTETGRFTVSYNGIGFYCRIGSGSTGSQVLLSPAGGEGYLVNWNISVNNLHATNLTVDQNATINQILYAKDIYMWDTAWDPNNQGMNKDTMCRVATQPWVIRQLNDSMWDRVVNVNNIAANATKLAKDALSKANSALSKINPLYKQGVNIKEIVYNLVGNEVAGTLTWSTVGGTGGNFNIASTPFYKNGVEAAWNDACSLVKFTAGEGSTCQITVPTPTGSSPGGSMGFPYTHNLVLKITGTSNDSVSLVDNNATILAKIDIASSKTDGWNNACSYLKFTPGEGSSCQITVPVSTANSPGGSTGYTSTHTLTLKITGNNNQNVSLIDNNVTTMASINVMDGVTATWKVQNTGPGILYITCTVKGKIFSYTITDVGKYA